jgi:hypothetical protein
MWRLRLPAGRARFVRGRPSARGSAAVVWIGMAACGEYEWDGGAVTEGPTSLRVRNAESCRGGTV